MKLDFKNVDKLSLLGGVLTLAGIAGKFITNASSKKAQDKKLEEVVEKKVREIIKNQ